MTSRDILTASLVTVTAAISASLAVYWFGLHPDDDQADDTGMPVGTVPGPRVGSPIPPFARMDDASRPPNSDGASSRSIDEDVRELQEAVTALTRAVAALERDRREYADEDQDSFDEQVDSIPGAGQSTGYLAQKFEAELPDSAWAARMEPLISNIFGAGDFPDSQLIYYSCKSTTCRLEVDHGDTVAAENFMFQLLPRISDEFPAVATQLVDDAYGLRSVVMLGNVD